VYHHTLLLTFRPFLILRAKLKQESSSSGPPPWLDTACEYCLEAARNMISFLAGACATNPFCAEIRYHGFFIEGACYTLAFDMLQASVSAHRNLPWIHAGLGCLRTMISKRRSDKGQIPITSDAIKQMVLTVYPNLDLERRGDAPIAPQASQAQPENELEGNSNSNVSMTAPTGLSGTIPTSDGRVQMPIPSMPFMYPFMPFGFDANGNVSNTSPDMRSDEQIDFTAADVGWDIDFGTMDMEAFFSLDTNQSSNFAS
jgi:hypothetical protein